MNFKKFDEYFYSLEKIGYPMAQARITKGYEVIHEASFGFEDEKKTRPITNDSLYWFFSISKTVTTVAALTLIDKGLLGPDDPVSKYLPRYADLTVAEKDGTLRPAKGEMTIRHLFTMQSGLDYNFDNPCTMAFRKEHPNASTLEIVNTFPGHPIRFDPGTHYLYSLSHDVLAAVVEVVSGMPFGEYCRKVIFDPLGMKEIGLHPTAEQLEKMCDMYHYDNGLAIAKPDARKYNRFQMDDPNYESGGAGFFGSINSYMPMVTTLACGGKTKDGYVLLSEDTIRQYCERNSLCDAALNDFSSFRFHGWGWGFCGRVHMRPEYSRRKCPVGSFGWDGAYNAYAHIDRQNQIGFTFLTHVGSGTYGYARVHPELTDLIYEE